MRGIISFFRFCLSHSIHLPQTLLPPKANIAMKGLKYNFMMHSELNLSDHLSSLICIPQCYGHPQATEEDNI